MKLYLLIPLAIMVFLAIFIQIKVNDLTKDLNDTRNMVAEGKTKEIKYLSEIVKLRSENESLRLEQSYNRPTTQPAKVTEQLKTLTTEIVGLRNQIFLLRLKNGAFVMPEIQPFEP